MPCERIQLPCKLASFICWGVSHPHTPRYFRPWDYSLDVGIEGARAPHFSKTQAKCLFSCNLIAIVKSFENAKIIGKNTFSTVSEDHSFKISRRRTLPVGLALFHHAKSFILSASVLSPGKVLNHHHHYHHHHHLVLSSLFAPEGGLGLTLGSVFACHLFKRGD